MRCPAPPSGSPRGIGPPRTWLWARRAAAALPSGRALCAPSRSPGRSRADPRSGGGGRGDGRAPPEGLSEPRGGTAGLGAPRRAAVRGASGRAGTATLTGERAADGAGRPASGAQSPELPPPPEPAAGPAPGAHRGAPPAEARFPPLPRRGPVPPRSLPRLLVGSARLAAVPRRAALLSARQRPGSGSALPPDRGAAGAALRPPAVCGCPATAGPGPPGAAPGRRQLAPGPRLKAQRRLGAEPPPGGAAEGGWGGHGGAVGTRAGTVRSERGNGRGGVRVRTGTAGP